MNCVQHATQALTAAASGYSLLGEIITWSTTRAAIIHLDLVRALREAGLDESVARELAPRCAFSRACHVLSEARIIRQVAEDETTISFQFTAERRTGDDRFEYDFETLLSLEKATGRVTCDKPELAARAQTELDRCLDVRTAGDVTRVVQRLFERQADLFPIREQGGAYFVPQRHMALVDRVETFLRSLNGKIHRFPIPTGTSQGDRSVKDAVAGGIAALIAEHEAAIAGFTADTRPSTLERAAEQIRVTRHKIESYACYLAEQTAHLERDLAAASQKLRAKIEQLAAESEVGHGTLLSGASA